MIYYLRERNNMAYVVSARTDINEPRVDRYWYPVGNAAVEMTAALGPRWNGRVLEKISLEEFVPSNLPQVKIMLRDGHYTTFEHTDSLPVRKPTSLKNRKARWLSGGWSTTTIPARRLYSEKQILTDTKML